MPRLVHLAPASAVRSIERSGVRGAPWELASAGGPLSLRKAVFAMPVVEDFAATHQWVRELGRGRDEAMVAVHLVLPRGEGVYVGRYGQVHEPVSLSDAIGWVRKNAAGAQIVVPRSITAREVATVRAISQRLGWVETPEARSHYDCVCIACIPPGSRDLQRRVRAAFAKSLRDARAATSHEALAEALGRLGTPLERAGGRLSPRKILPYARSESEQVRRAVAWLLADFRAADVEATLRRLVEDASATVRESAVEALVRQVGLVRAGKRVEAAGVDAVVAFVDQLDCAADVGVAARILRRLACRPEAQVLEAVERVARGLLQEPGPEAPVRAELETLVASRGDRRPTG